MFEKTAKQLARKLGRESSTAIIQIRDALQSAYSAGLDTNHCPCERDQLNKITRIDPACSAHGSAKKGHGDEN